MNYSIEFYKSALKYLQKLDKPNRTRIVHALQILSDNPFHSELDIKRMKGLFCYGKDPFFVLLIIR